MINLKSKKFKLIASLSSLLIVMIFILSACFSNKDIYSRIDNKLKSKHFNYSDVDNSKPYSIIIYNTETHAISSINEYNGINDDLINIDVNPNDTFIISLQTFSTVTCSWKNLNTINENFLSLDHESSIDLNPESKKVNYGSGIGRQNFYFTALNSGSQILNFEYKSDSSESTESFKLNFSINIA